MTQGQPFGIFLVASYHPFLAPSTYIPIHSLSLPFSFFFPLLVVLLIPFSPLSYLLVHIHRSISHFSFFFSLNLERYPSFAHQYVPLFVFPLFFCLPFSLGASKKLLFEREMIRIFFSYFLSFFFVFFFFLFLVYKHGLGKRNVSLRLYNSCVHHIYTFVYINYYLLDITKVSSRVLLSHMHKSELRRGGGKWFLLRTNLYTLIISTLALSQALFSRSCPVLSTSPSRPPSLLASLAPSTPTFPIGPIHTSAKVP